MVTEGHELLQIVGNSDLVCAYFVILENSVVFISQQSDLAEANSGQGTVIPFTLSLSLSLSFSLSPSLTWSLTHR